MEKYNFGFVLGVFDLFHIGHLNLIRNAKERCNYLMAGIVIDALPLVVKGVLPAIPFNERFEIVRSIRYVDEVVKVDFDNALRKQLWEQYKFDCFFCGDDYADREYMYEQQQWMRDRGSELMFLPYTKDRTSTEIRKSLLIEK